jgi:hypothetical protein
MGLGSLRERRVGGGRVSQSLLVVVAVATVGRRE